MESMTFELLLYVVDTIHGSICSWNLRLTAASQNSSRHVHIYSSKNPGTFEGMGSHENSPNFAKDWFYVVMSFSIKLLEFVGVNMESFQDFWKNFRKATFRNPFFLKFPGFLIKDIAYASYRFVRKTKTWREFLQKFPEFYAEWFERASGWNSTRIFRDLLFAIPLYNTSKYEVKEFTYLYY